MCQHTCKSIATAYEDDITEIQCDSLDTETSEAAHSNKLDVNSRTEKCIEEITNLYSTYRKKCDNCMNRLKAANIVLVENIKFFSEEGTFSVHEVAEILKNMKINEERTDQVIYRIRQQIKPDKVSGA